MERQVAVYLHTPFSRRAGAGESSRDLLARAASLHTGLPAERFASPARTGRGRPCFPDFPDLFFSVSHSGDLWLCAMDGENVGLDAQVFCPLPRRADIARHFFHPKEREYLENHPADAAFFRIWTAKESLCKYRGTGIDGAFSAFAVSDGETLLPRTEDAFLHPFALSADCAACLCTASPAVPRILTF